MNFDTLVLASVADELRQTVLGGRVERVTQPSTLDIVVWIYSANRKRAMLVSASPDSPRIHLARSESRPNPIPAPNFCMLLRKYLEGAWLQSITHPQGLGERVLQLTFSAHAQHTVHLYVEIMGRQSNIVLTNDAGTILGSVKRVTKDMSRFREIRPGIPYTIPPRVNARRRDAFGPTAGNGLPQVDLAGREEAATWLGETFRGISPLMAQEAVVALPDGPVQSESVWYALNELLNRARLNEYAPVVITNAEGRAVDAYPIKLLTVEESRQKSFDTIGEALDTANTESSETSSLERERKALESAIRRALKLRERELLDVRNGLENAGRSEDWKRMGEMLVANRQDISRGSAVVSLPDSYSEEGTLLTISLDPAMDAQENAQRYFKRYKKARDSQEILIERLAEVEKSIEHLQAALTKAGDLNKTSDVVAMAEDLRSELPERPQADQPDSAQSLFEGHKIKRLHSPDGWEILVGENAASNDYLTTRVAAAADIWLHARAVPSAHAVIRARNRPVAVSSAAIHLAAEQVARRSQSKHARMVSIDYTLRKYVRKPRGSAPGQVTYTNEKTLDIVLDQEGRIG